MSKQRYKVRNAAEYNKALIKRGDLTVWISQEAVESWMVPVDHKGRRMSRYTYDETAIICALTLRQLFRLPLRQTQGLVSSLLKIMKAPLKTPTYSTLSRRAKTLNLRISASAKSGPRQVLIDSTGVRIVGEGEWKKLKHGESRCQVWRKLHLTIDANTLDILSAKMTDSVRFDANYLPDLLEAIPGEITEVIGDGAYDKKNCYRAIYARKAKPIIPPQRNAIVQRNKYKKDRALVARDRVILQVGKGESRPDNMKAWKEAVGYHRRSLVETNMFRLKTIFGDELRSRSPANQLTDLLIRCNAINTINSMGLPETERVG